MPHFTMLPDIPYSPHGGETPQVPCTRASRAAEVTKWPWWVATAAGRQGTLWRNGGFSCQTFLQLGRMSKNPLSMGLGTPAILLSTGGASCQEATRDTVLGAPLGHPPFLIPTRRLNYWGEGSFRKWFWDIIRAYVTFVPLLLRMLQNS